MSWPRIRFWQSIDYTRGIVSGGGWLAAGVRCEVTDSTLNCLNVGQGQWFLWSLRERAECIYTTVSKSATGKNWNKEEMRNKKSSLSYLLLERVIELWSFFHSFTFPSIYADQGECYPLRAMKGEVHNSLLYRNSEIFWTDNNGIYLMYMC